MALWSQETLEAMSNSGMPSWAPGQLPSRCVLWHAVRRAINYALFTRRNCPLTRLMEHCGTSLANIAMIYAMASQVHAADVLAMAACPSGDAVFAAGVDPQLALYRRVPGSKGGFSGPAPRDAHISLMAWQTLLAWQRSLILQGHWFF